MFQNKSPKNTTPDEPLGPPCAACAGPFRIDAWGYPLCEPCASGWAKSPECRAVNVELEPHPLWELARMKPEERPPEPSDGMRREAFRRGVRAWMARRANEVAPRLSA